MVKSESSKCLKASEGSIDRISNLPDPLISRFLSLLPTKCAVATSVLSTRWKFLWTSITNLHFDSGCPRYNLSKSLITMKRNKFTNFVNRVLLLLNPPPIQNFHLTCSQEHFDLSYLNSWISVGLERTVRELDISLTLKKPVELTLSHISCNVVVLKLKGDIHFNIPSATSICFPSLETLHLWRTTLAISSNSFVSFPNLKILHLGFVKYANEDSVRKLLSSSPVLDDLVIDRGNYDNLFRLTIRIPSLTRLKFGNRPLNDRPFKLQLDTPALQYLNLVDSLPCEYLLMGNLSSLLQANVKLYFDNENAVNVLSCNRILKFIGSLSKVKFLSVSGAILKAIGIASTNISCFHNLTRLELVVHNCLDLSVVVNNLLESMDNLEHLVIEGWLSCHCSHRSWWTEPQYVPKCLLSRVTTISFTCTGVGFCGQLELLLRYFLKNAKVLQLLTICADVLCEKKQPELLKKISMFPRGSQTCQVYIEAEV